MTEAYTKIHLNGLPVSRPRQEPAWVEDDTERERVFDAGGKKYPQIAEQSKGQIPDGVWLFRAERRS